jgi:hypothetical protein
MELRQGRDYFSLEQIAVIVRPERDGQALPGHEAVKYVLDKIFGGSSNDLNALMRGDCRYSDYVKARVSDKDLIPSCFLKPTLARFWCEAPLTEAENAAGHWPETAEFTTAYGELSSVLVDIYLDIRSRNSGGIGKIQLFQGNCARSEYRDVAIECADKENRVRVQLLTGVIVGESELVISRNNLELFIHEDGSAQARLQTLRVESESVDAVPSLIPQQGIEPGQVNGEEPNAENDRFIPNDFSKKPEKEKKPHKKRSKNQNGRTQFWDAVEKWVCRPGADGQSSIVSFREAASRNPSRFDLKPLDEIPSPAAYGGGNYYVLVNDDEVSEGTIHNRIKAFYTKYQRSNTGITK